ncbi:hypothetical protein [Desulfocurvus sp. DL9XJH121]
MSEHRALEDIRARGFLGLCFMGVAAGLAAAQARGGDWVVLPVTGLVGTMLCCWVGGGLGMSLRLVLGGLRGRGSGLSLNSEGCLVLGGYGAFLGLVASGVSGSLGAAHAWAMVGAAVGGAVAGGLGEGVLFLTRMLVLFSMDEAQRARAMAESARKTSESLLWPGEDGADPPPEKKRR